MPASPFTRFSDGFAPWRRPLALVSAWCGVGLGVAWLRPIRSDGLDCTFVSVGHGCAVVVELPDGQVLLSDAGPARIAVCRRRARFRAASGRAA